MCKCEIEVFYLASWSLLLFSFFFLLFCNLHSMTSSVVAKSNMTQGLLSIYHVTKSWFRVEKSRDAAFAHFFSFFPFCSTSKQQDKTNPDHTAQVSHWRFHFDFEITETERCTLSSSETKPLWICILNSNFEFACEEFELVISNWRES